MRPVDVFRVAAAAVALLALVSAAALPAQTDIKPPAGTADADRAAEQDPALETHIEYLIQRIEHENRIVRRSVHQGLIGAGSAAVPALERLAGDPATSQGKIAARLLQQIRTRAERQEKRTEPAPVPARAPGDRRPGRGEPGPLSEDDVARALAAVGADATVAAPVKAIVEEHRRRMGELRKAGRGADAPGVQDQQAAAMETYLDRLSELLGKGRAALFIRALDRSRAGAAPPRAPRAPRADRSKKTADG